MVGKWLSFLLLAQIALFIGADVIPLDDVELLQVPSDEEVELDNQGEDAIKTQEVELDNQERRSLVASQAASRTRNEADRAYRNSLRISERVMDGKHRSQAAQDTHTRAKEEHRRASADLVRSESELSHQEVAQKQLNDEIERRAGGTSKALQEAQSQVQLASKRANQQRAARQQSEDKAREESASANRAAAAAVGALADLQLQIRNAAAKALDASVANAAKKVAMEQQQSEGDGLSGAQSTAQLEKSKAEEAALVAERVQEKMEEANSAAQEATSAALAEKGRQAAAVAEARSQKELADDAVESETAKLAAFEQQVRQLQSKESSGADQLKEQEGYVKQAQGAKAEKQREYMKDQLQLGQEKTMAHSGVTPELRQAQMSVDQAKKSVRESRLTYQQAARTVTVMKEEMKQAEYSLSDVKSGQVAHIEQGKKQMAAAQALIVEEEAKVKAARDAARYSNARLKEEQRRKIQDEKALEDQVHEETTKKKKAVATLHGELGAAEAEEEAEKETLRAVKQQAAAKQLKAEQEHARQMQLEADRTAAREAALAAAKRDSDRASDGLKMKAAFDIRALKRTANAAQDDAHETAKQLQTDFEDAQKSSKSQAQVDVHKSEVNAKRSKQQADDKTAHMLAQAQSSPATPCNSTDMDATDMAQEALDASMQEANAMMAVEAAALGKQVAQQVEAEVSGAKGEAKGMMRDDRQMALKERKASQDEARRQKQIVAEKDTAEKLLILQAKEAGTEMQQAARTDARAIKAQMQAETRLAHDSAKAEEDAQNKARELQMAEEEEKLHRSKLKADALAATARSAETAQEKAEEEQIKKAAEIRELQDASLHMLHAQQEQEKSMIAVQLKALENAEEHMHRLRKKIAAETADDTAINAAQVILAESQAHVSSAQRAVTHAEQVKEGAMEGLSKMQDELEDVKAAVALKMSEVQGRIAEVQRVHDISELAFNKAKQRYQAEEEKYHAVRESWRRSKSSLDKSHIAVGQSKLVLEQASRQAEQREADLQRALVEQMMLDNKSKLQQQQATQKAKYESDQYSKAEQDMKSDQRSADSQENKVAQDKKQAELSEIRESSASELQLAELASQEAAAVKKNAELAHREKQFISNVESTKAHVLALAVSAKTGQVQLDNAVQQAKEEISEWNAKQQILQNKLQRFKAQNNMKQANQDGLVASAAAHKRMASQEVVASQSRAEDAGTAADEAAAAVAKLEKELAESQMLQKKLSSKSKQLEIVADDRSRGRDTAAAQLDQLQRAQEQSDQMAATSEIKQSRSEAVTSRNNADAATLESDHVKTQTEKRISRYELDVKDHEAELKVDKNDNLAASRLKVRKAQSDAVKAVTEMEGTLARAKLRANAAEEQEKIVVDASQKQSKIERDASYEKVREAKIRTSDAEALSKKALLSKKREEALAQRAESRNLDFQNEQPIAEASEVAARKKKQTASDKKIKLEGESMQELAEVKKTHHTATVRAAGFQRQLDKFESAAGAAKLHADKQSMILESEKDRLRDATRVANNEMANAQRDAKFSVTKSQADLESTRREAEDSMADVTSELNSQLTTLKGKLNQQVDRAKQKAELEFDRKSHAFQIEVDQAKQNEKEAADRRLKFEDEAREQQTALTTANEKVATMKAEAESLRNSLFNKIDKDENDAISREEFASPFDSESKLD